MKNKDDIIEQSIQEIEKDLPQPIDISKFKPMTMSDLTDILGITIKKDETNKLVTFFSLLSAYTDSSQFNLSFNAPSSTGKSYIPLEVSKLFPDEDLIKLGSCSPTAFYHEQGEFDKEKNSILVNLERKIIIFLDQPNNQLLIRLRSLFSHDEKEIQSKITDKNQRGGNRTKTVIIRGFPSVVFCSAGLRIDEQESTRFLLLSPEITQEKIREAVHYTVNKEADRKTYEKNIKQDERRILLKERVKAIKDLRIQEIQLNNPDEIEERFLKGAKNLKPRHSRDIKRLVALIKSITLLNVFFREKTDEGVIVANGEDIEDAFKIWDEISESQELNLPPFIHNLYKEVILPVFKEINNNAQGFQSKEVGITRQDVLKKHYDVHERHLPDWQLRQQILPMLETSGLIRMEPDEDDKRRILIYANIL